MYVGVEKREKTNMILAVAMLLHTENEPISSTKDSFGQATYSRLSQT